MAIRFIPLDPQLSQINLGEKVYFPGSKYKTMGFMVTRRGPELFVVGYGTQDMEEVDAKRLYETGIFTRVASDGKLEVLAKTKPVFEETTPTSS